MHNYEKNANWKGLLRKGVSVEMRGLELLAFLNVCSVILYTKTRAAYLCIYSICGGQLSVYKTDLHFRVFRKVLVVHVALSRPRRHLYHVCDNISLWSQVVLKTKLEPPCDGAVAERETTVAIPHQSSCPTSKPTSLPKFSWNTINQFAIQKSIKTTYVKVLHHESTLQRNQVAPWDLFFFKRREAIVSKFRKYCLLKVN